MIRAAVISITLLKSSRPTFILLFLDQTLFNFFTFFGLFKSFILKHCSQSYYSLSLFCDFRKPSV